MVKEAESPKSPTGEPREPETKSGENPEANPNAQNPPPATKGVLHQLIQSAFQIGLFLMLFRWFQSGNQPSTAQPAALCSWPLGTAMNLDIFVSESADLFPIIKNPPESVFHLENLGLGDWLDTPSTHLLNNGSLYAHIFLYQPGVVVPAMAAQNIVYKRKAMNYYRPKKSFAEFRNLLSASESNSTNSGLISAKDSGEIVSHWNRNLTLNLIADMTTISHDEIKAQPALTSHVQFTNPQLSAFHPVLFLNDFWLLNEDLLSFPINETVTSLPLTIDFNTLSSWKFRLMLQMDESFKIQKSMMGVSDNEVDNLRRAIFETNPWLLGITFVVSLLHSLFDFLAFKNDISFWKDQKSFEGLSLRTVSLNVILQLVILLYLFDNETSWLILGSTVVGFFIEVWKWSKIIGVRIDRQVSSLFGMVPFRIVFYDKTPRTSMRQATDEYDAIAYRYLGWACIPLVIGYSVYSLFYESHKSWYSWVIGTAVGFVYTFGFISMTPQLFINYKLKSVAHMPWRTFMYKALNTFVDDLFAFIIKMPTLHRLACFRDDIIFLIYLYQRWVYPVDKKRPNEFGQVAENEDVSEKDSIEKKTQ